MLGLGRGNQKRDHNAETVLVQAKREEAKAAAMGSILFDVLSATTKIQKLTDEKGNEYWDASFYVPLHLRKSKGESRLDTWLERRETEIVVGTIKMSHVGDNLRGMVDQMMFEREGVTAAEGCYFTNYPRVYLMEAKEYGSGKAFVRFSSPLIKSTDTNKWASKAVSATFSSVMEFIMELSEKRMPFDYDALADKQRLLQSLKEIRDVGTKLTLLSVFPRDNTKLIYAKDGVNGNAAMPEITYEKI